MWQHTWRYGEKYYMNFVGNLVLIPAVKEVWKSVKNWQSYRREFGVLLFGGRSVVIKWSNCIDIGPFVTILDKEDIREGRRSDGNSTDGSCWENECFRNKQVGVEPERHWNCVQSAYSVDVAQGLYTGVLTWPQVDEFVLLPAEASAVRRWCKDVCEGLRLM